MEIRISAIDAVNALYGGSSYQMADANGNVKWKDGHETTAEETAAINAKIIELQADYDALAYARNRFDSYPSIDDVTVALAEKAEGDSTMWDKITAERSAVKAKFPKPE